MATSPSSRVGSGWSPRRASLPCDRCRAPPPARACARWCWAVRVGWGSSPRRRSTCAVLPPERRILGYLFPDLGGRPGRDARHRRERGLAVGHARVRRPRDRVLVRHAQRPDGARPRQVEGAEDLPQRAGAGTSRRCACRSSATRAAPTTWPPSASSASGSSSATAGCPSAPARASCTTRRSSTPPTSATSCSTAALQPTCRRPRRRGASCRLSTTTVMAAGHGAFHRAGRARLS